MYKNIETQLYILLSVIQSNNKMNYQIPFSIFGGGGGGPNGPNIGKQLLMIFGVWLTAKICIKRPRGGGGGDSCGAYKYKKPVMIPH